MAEIADDQGRFITPIFDFDEAWKVGPPDERLGAVRKAASGLHERLISAKAVPFFQSTKLAKAPYPTKFAFLNACSMPTPFLHIVNRLFVVQVPFGGSIKTLLLSPTNVARAGETPFFKNLSDSLGPLRNLGERVLGERTSTVPDRLREMGIAPEEVDYISYDHLHTQDVREWIGTGTQRGLFPSAKLLVMRQEWESANALLPTQAEWYCPDGVDGVDPSRVVLLDHSVLLGGSLALIRSPGHTEGNHSFVTRTEMGVLVTSENGVGPDAYAPLHSRIPGLRKHAQRTGAEVILNGNTLESSVNQYISMVMEKTIAGPSHNLDFPNLVCSSEFDAHWAFPGLTPTFKFGDLALGRVQHGKADRAESTSDAAASGARA